MILDDTTRVYYAHRDQKPLDFGDTIDHSIMIDGIQDDAIRVTTLGDLHAKIADNSLDINDYFVSTDYVTLESTLMLSVKRRRLIDEAKKVLENMTDEKLFVFVRYGCVPWQNFR